jgi:hypothetical protein
MIVRTRIAGQEWLKIIRAPRLKVLRTHLFGLTLGLTALLTHLLFPGSAGRIISLVSLYWLLIGYSFGFTFALSYNYLAYLYLRIIHPEWMKLWFYYNPNQEVNIIKTPIPDVDWPNNASRPQYEAALFKVFDYASYEDMGHPYTIVFVANPYIVTRDFGLLLPDPIMDDENLFLKAVERALFSFEFNHEVVGRPDILSKIRIITINHARIPRAYDPGNALVKEFAGAFEVPDPDGGVIPFATFKDRMLAPEEGVRVNTFVRDALKREKMGHIEHIDVIFMISASLTHDMSSAEAAEMKKCDQEGEAFTFSIDPYCQKGDEILKNECELLLCQPAGSETPKELRPCCKQSVPLERINGPDRLMIHEFFPSETHNGRVAMSAFDVRPKLPIHEFAHAMSSYQNGRIVDEYYDHALIQDPKSPKPQTQDPEYPKDGILVNRIYRNPVQMRENHSVKVHNIFARYNGYVYESDRQHHSSRQGWFSYFPDRRNREVLCIMDAAQDVFEFDELIRDFMYDRLWAKVNRDYLSGASSSGA